VLSLYSLEQWIGRELPETLDLDQASLMTLGPVQPGMASAVASEQPQVASGETPAKAIIKVGGSFMKEEDNVVGYWRFEEREKATQEEELALGQVMGVFLDISKYGNRAFAVSDSASALTVVPTVSPTDPGEPGKVREAFDVCFSSNAISSHSGTAAVQRGVLLPCLRGSSLDIGGYNTDENRCGMTFEMWARIGTSALDELTTASHVLAERHSKVRGRIEYLWRIMVEPDGALRWHSGSDDTAVI